MNDLYDATLLETSFCISGVLNDVFVSGLPGLVDFSSSTVVTFSSVRACFCLPLSCLWSTLSITTIFFINVSSSSLLQYVFENSVSILPKRYFLNWYKFLIRALSSMQNDVMTLPVYRHCIKNYYLQYYRLLLFKNTRNVSKTKHYSIWIWKLVEFFFQKISFCIYIMVILVIFDNLCFTW